MRAMISIAWLGREKVEGCYRTTSDVDAYILWKCLEAIRNPLDSIASVHRYDKHPPPGIVAVRIFALISVT